MKNRNEDNAESTNQQHFYKVFFKYFRVKAFIQPGLTYTIILLK